MPIFQGKITDGKLKLDKPEHLNLFLAKIKNYPAVLVKIEKRQNVRSLKHNAYYRGYVLPEICIAYPEIDQTRMHEILKEKIISQKFDIKNGVEFPLPRETKNMNPAEFSDFVNKVKLLGTEMWGIIWMDEEIFLAMS